MWASRALVMLALSACASGTGTSGVLHGDVTVHEGGEISGVLLWEFFAQEGDSPAEPEGHLCARLLEVVGEPDSDSECDDCAVAVTLAVTDVEHDCSDKMGIDKSLAAMDRLWIRPGPGDRSSVFPDDRWSWALGWGQTTPAAEGVAWDEGFEFGEPPSDPSSLVRRRVRLAPDSARVIE